MAGVVTAVAAVFLVTVAAVALVVNSASSEPSGDRARPASTSAVVWDRTVAEDVYGVATDGEIACATGGDELFCVEADSGVEVFSERLPGAGTAPALVGETLVVAVDGDPGEGGPVEGGPVEGGEVEGGPVEGGSGRGHLSGYSTAGELLWQSGDLHDLYIEDATLGLYADVPAAGGVVAVPVDDAMGGAVAGIDAQSGEELWRASAGGSVLRPVGPVVSDGERFYVNTLAFGPDTAADLLADPTAEPTSAIVAIDAASGAEVWRSEVAPDELGVEAAARTADGAAVALTIAGEPGRVMVVDAATGAPRWEVPVTSDWVTVAQLDGVIVVADGSQLRGYDAAGGELWSGPDPDGNPGGEPIPPELVVSEGRLLAFRLDLHEIDPSDGAAHRLGSHTVAEDVAVAGDHLIVAGNGLEAITLPG